MKQTVRRLLADPQTRAAFTKAGGSDLHPHLVSLSRTLPGTIHDWLDWLPATAPWWYRALPAQGQYRLGIGHAMTIVSSGPQRFMALDKAWSGICQDWQLGDAHPCAFAGFAFDPQAGHTPLPNAVLAIPTLLLESCDGQARLTITAPAGQLPVPGDPWCDLLLTTRAIAPTAPSKTIQDDGLLRQAWATRVAAALREIDAGRLNKLVLSRSTQWVGNTDFSPAIVLHRLLHQQPDATIYGHGQARLAFIGATPERLVQRRGRAIAIDALAGTAWPGSTTLNSTKNRHEQAVVVDAILAAIRPYLDDAPTVHNAQPHPAGHLTHWRSRIGGLAHPDTRLFNLVAALHPTPAVGGFPREPALSWLNRHHEQRLGWYSGGIGVMHPNGDGEISVALRSALLDGPRARLQAGAGIVAGSDAEAEWAEITAKLATMGDALIADAGCDALHQQTA